MRSLNILMQKLQTPFLCWYFTLSYTSAVIFWVNENTFLTVTKIKRRPLGFLSQKRILLRPQNWKEVTLVPFSPLCSLWELCCRTPTANICIRHQSCGGSCKAETYMLMFECGGQARLSRWMKCGMHVSRCTDLGGYPKVKVAEVLRHVFCNATVPVHEPFNCKSSSYHNSNFRNVWNKKNLRSSKIFREGLIKNKKKSQTLTDKLMMKLLLKYLSLSWCVFHTKVS